MDRGITHTGSIEIDDVSNACRQELASLVQSTELPVVIRLGDRKCIVIMLPAESRKNASVPETAYKASLLHRPEYGELKAALKEIALELELEKGGTVPARRVHLITNKLRGHGLDVNFETVRSKLRQMGFYTERKR